MPMPLRKRVSLMVAGAAAVLVIVVMGGTLYIQHQLKERIVQALGPLGSAGDIDVGLRSIVLSDVRLKGPDGWPAPDTLRADRITLVPDLRNMLGGGVHLREVVVSGFDLSALRTKDGRIQILPNLQQTLNQPASGESASSAALPQPKLIDHVSFEHGVFDFYDLTVRQPAYKVTISDASATVDHLRLPELDEPTKIAVDGVIKGPEHDGTVSFGGWITIATKDSQTTIKLQGVDVAALDPYLLQKAGATARIESGTLDLLVDSTVHDYRLHAPGVLTLHRLRLADTGNPVDTFMSSPTRAALAALKTHGDDITLHFTLDGDLHNPKFSLNESLTTKLGAGFANALGVSAQDVAKGAGDTAKGLGGALLNLLGH